MLARRSIGALGLIVTALGLAALAHTLRSAPHPAAATRGDVPGRSAPSASGNTNTNTSAATRTNPRANANANAGRASAGVAALREGGQLDINRASAAELELLPGIGPRLAERILARRAARGPFADVQQLTGVSGIGERTLERLRPLITVATAGTAGRPHMSKNNSTPPVIER
jgi:competence protein ComEA